MKKIITISAVALMLLSATSFAQTNPEAPKRTKATETYFELMVKGTSTNLNYGAGNAALKDYKKSNDGIQAGISFQGGVTPMFSLVTELYYLRKGAELNEGNPLTGSYSKTRISTLELPVMARLHLGKLYLNAGPSLAYNLAGHTSNAGQSTQISFNGSANAMTRLDAGIQMGGGIEIPIKEKRLALDIRYAHGLSDIAKSGELHTRALMVSVQFSKAWKKNPLAKKQSK